MPEGNAAWAEHVFWLSPYALDPSCDSYTQFSCERTLRLGGDTLVNGMAYDRVYREGQCHFEMVGATSPDPNCPYSGDYAEPPALIGMIRQDTANRTVYWFDTDFQQEYLLYDFTMEIGPYPQTYNNAGNSGLMVTAIDSVLLGDGYHKRFLLNDQSPIEQPFVLEGIGSFYGLMAPLIPWFESGSSLSCFAHDGILVYADTNFTEPPCDALLSVDPIQREPIIEVPYPNPGTDHITVQLPPGPHVITLLDATGRSLLERRTSEQEFEINTSELSPGIYLVRIDNGPGIRWVKE